MDVQIEDVYAAARRGAWDDVLARWAHDPPLAAQCAHYVRPTSGWTFLHQAAYFGNEPACRVLIRWGATVDCPARDGSTPAEVAEGRGHTAVAAVLVRAASGARAVWGAPRSIGVLPSSCLWSEASPRTATHPLTVAYAGGESRIPVGCAYYVDSFERVLVGWHWTISPPLDMAGYPLVDIRGRADGPAATDP